MEFSYVDFNRLNFELIKNLFTKLEILELRRCIFDGERFGALIESCINLKRLTLECPDLPVRKHPTLEHLEFHRYLALENVELKTFLEQSPNLRSLEINANHLWEIRVSILNANVELNDLTICWNFYLRLDADAFVVLLNELYRRRFYKRLHLTSDLLPHDELPALPGLVTLYHRAGQADYPLLINVKEFVIFDGRDKYINPTPLVNTLINVEHIFACFANIGFILPLIRNLLKLKAIYINRFDGNVLDVRALNRERNKLLGAQKVTIYVDEEAYLATKWASKGTTFDLIEIRRRSSNDIIRPYSFWRKSDCP